MGGGGSRSANEAWHSSTCKERSFVLQMDSQRQYPQAGGGGGLSGCINGKGPGPPPLIRQSTSMQTTFHRYWPQVTQNARNQ